MKLELLRQKTVLDRRILSMKNTIHRKRFDFLEYLASLLQQPLGKIQQQLDLVENHLNRDIQLIRLTETLKLHDENQSLSFLRVRLTVNQSTSMVPLSYCPRHQPRAHEVCFNGPQN